MTLFNVSSDGGLKKLDEYLLFRSYITGKHGDDNRLFYTDGRPKMSDLLSDIVNSRFQASKDDLTVHASLVKPPPSDLVNVSRWYNHIEALLRISGVSGEGCGVTIEGSAPATKEAIATPPVSDSKDSVVEDDDDDDDVDLFGEETEEEKKAAEERAAAVKASGKKKESTRIMNAIFLRELEKKEKAGGSSSAPKKQGIPAVTTNTKGNCSIVVKKPAGSPTVAKKKSGSSSSTKKRVSSPPPQAESPPHSGKKKTSSDPSSSIQRKGKRKLSEISITSALSQETSGSDDEQPSRPGIHPLYTPESVIVGRGPTHIAQKLLFQLPSHADAAFLNSLGWSDLTRRTCSSLTEGIMYLGELVERTDVLRSNDCHDSREGRALRDQLQTTIDETKATHAKELSESQARYDELLEKKKKKEEELQRLIEDHTKEIQKLKEESKISRAEAAQARRDLQDAKAQHVKEASSFKTEFLKSEEFNEICGPKALHYLEVGFEGVVNLFKAHGYPPTGASTDFISLRDFVASLPPDL